MKNEYGVPLDKNGYSPSVIDLFDDEKCFCCWRSGDLARHEVFHGNNRTKSKNLGCWVRLCPDCHNKLHTKDGTLDEWLKKEGQKAAMKHYGWTTDEFRQRFGKNYL